MPIEPAPAPTSQSSSPGRGIRWANAEARTSRLVSCPSCSYASSGRPVASVAKGAGPATSTQTTFERRHVGRVGVPRLVGATQVAQHGQRARRVATSGQQRRNLSRALRVPGEDDRPLSREQPAAELVHIVAAQPDHLDRLGRPAHPRPGQGDRRHRGMDPHRSRDRTARPASSPPRPAGGHRWPAPPSIAPRARPAGQAARPAGRPATPPGADRRNGGSRSRCRRAADDQIGRPDAAAARPARATPSRRADPDHLDHGPDPTRPTSASARSSRTSRHAVPIDSPPSTGST